MTNYGTIPTSSSPGPSSTTEYISRAKERVKEGLADRRPWKLMFNIRSFNFPGNLSEAISRDEPLVVFSRTIDDRVVLVVLGVLTIVFLLLTDATPNILWSLFIGAAFVLVHASFRRTDDLYDEESGSLISSS
ncbi:hypothetical protein V6N13_033902 [Hibiscus sabdariffa]|uniref:PRA1 family protein n=1 Tax=Hibiscus sabdariffa TaxID=183260 RepID=A0ABR2F974_9ROSI